MEWRPIETAPKDGTRIVVVMPYNEQEKRSAIVYWFSGRWMNACEGRWYSAGLPTHWTAVP